jgi:hypothetical protein
MNEEQNHISITSKGEEENVLVYFQVANGDTDDRKVIDMLLDAPSGSDFQVEIVTNGKTLSFSVGELNVTDIVKTYNGVRFRKSA